MNIKNQESNRTVFYKQEFRNLDCGFEVRPQSTPFKLAVGSRFREPLVLRSRVGNARSHMIVAGLGNSYTVDSPLF